MIVSSEATDTDLTKRIRELEIEITTLKGKIEAYEKIICADQAKKIPSASYGKTKSS